MRIKKIIFYFAAGLLLHGTGARAKNSETAKRIDQPVHQSIKTRQATQKAEEKWQLEREKLAAWFERLRHEQEQLKSKKAELQGQVESIHGQIAKREEQLEDIEQISDQIRPFLDELIHELGSLMLDGLPFLTAERSQRIDRLKALMADPEVSISEKYRKVMEALLVEAEYGFTIETYQETISVEGQTMLADIFRLGRVSLFFQSLDQKRCGFYNIAESGWQTLSTSYNQQIQAAIDIAAKRRPAELLTIPVGRMVIP